MVRQLTEFLKDALSGADMSFTGLKKYVEINGKRYTKPELDELKGAAGYVGIGKALAGIVDDIADGQSFGHTVVWVQLWISGLLQLQNLSLLSVG